MLSRLHIRPARLFSITTENRPITFLALLFIILSAVFGWIAIKDEQEFAANLTTEFSGLAITIVAIDQIYRWRAKQERKREIIEQLGSHIHDATGEAVRLARNTGMLTDGSLRGATLVHADLIKAPLQGANLEEAYLGLAHLEGAHLGLAHLEGAHLEGAHMKGAHLAGAHLERAHLEGAELEGADLMGAHLEGAHLLFAELRLAYLAGAHLEGAHVKGADLEGADLTRATYNKLTVWPDGFDPVAAGCVLVKD